MKKPASLLMQNIFMIFSQIFYPPKIPQDIN